MPQPYNLFTIYAREDARLLSELLSQLKPLEISGRIKVWSDREINPGVQWEQEIVSHLDTADIILILVSPAYYNSEYILNTGGGSYPNPNQDSSTTVLVPVERLRQLEMPLMAYWQPARFLRVFGGISTAYTLSAKASEQNYANNQVYYAYDKSAQDNLNELTSSTLSRWQFNWQAGVGFRLGRHLEMGAFYKNGFSGSGNYDSGPLNDPSQSNGASSSHNTGTSHYFLLNGIWFF